MSTFDPRERQMLTASFAASIVAHAAALAIAPSLHRMQEVPTLEMLTVEILPAEVIPPLPLPSSAPVARPEAEPEPPPRPRPPPPVPRRLAPTPTPQMAARANGSAVSPPDEATPAASPPSPAPAASPPSPAPAVRAIAPASPPSLTPPSHDAAYLHNPAPRYPPAARRIGEQGTVTLRVLVTVEGIAGRVELERSSGSSLLDNAAVATVKTWRFLPARRGAEAVEATVLVPIVFRLDAGA